MKTKLKSLIIIFTIFFCFNIFAQSLPQTNQAFDSFVGAFLRTTPNAQNGVKIEADAVFAGQYYLNDKISVKGNFKIETSDISKNIFLTPTTAKFTIQEFSATYKFNPETIIQQLSGFIGEFDSFGSDAFVKKYFGVTNFSSPLLLPHLDIKTTAMYRYSGLGAAYTIKLSSPTAFGIYSFVDEINDLKNLNADFRFAKKWDSAVLDLGLGVALPMQRVDSAGKKVFLLIDHPVIHGGLSLLLGNNPITNLFLQAGITKLEVKPTAGHTPVSLQDIYIFMEPRFTTNFFKCNVAFFFLPDFAIKNLRYIEHQIGCNITLESPNFSLFKTNSKAGVNVTASFPSNALSAATENLDLQVSAYTDSEILNGNMEINLIIKPKQISDLSKFINLTVGYKTSL